MIKLCEVHSLFTSPIYVSVLPCKMQMLQIVTLCSDYQYQIAHLFIVSSTEDAKWFNNFVVLNILC